MTTGSGAGYCRRPREEGCCNPSKVTSPSMPGAYGAPFVASPGPGAVGLRLGYRSVHASRLSAAVELLLARWTECGPEGDGSFRRRLEQDAWLRVDVALRVLRIW